MLEGKRNGELKKFRKNETAVQEGTKDTQWNPVVLTVAFWDLNNHLSLLANVASNTDRLFLLYRNMHGATSVLINSVMKQKHIKQTLMMYIWKSDTSLIKATPGHGESWCHHCPGGDSCLCVLSTEELPFHYLRTEGGGQWYKWFWTLQDLAYVDLCVFIN
jgi:hypothetical protein